MSQTEKAAAFRKLHIPGTPLVLYNVWDPGSAKAVTAAGARAIATGSWSVAAANGYEDGEQVPIGLVLDNLARIVKATHCPVTIDLESGYGTSPAEVAASIAKTIAAGAVGCNIEDSFPDSGKLRDTAEQAERLGAARRAADATGVPYFINARTDVFLQASASQDESAIGQVLERAKRYAAAGADGLFVPGLIDEALITRLAAASPLPVNVMFNEKLPALNRLAKAGVARLSHGPGPYRQAMRALETAARAAMAAD